MSFWEDASGAVKGAIVFGAVGLLYFLVAWVGDLPPFSGGAASEEVQQVRGIQPPE